MRQTTRNSVAQNSVLYNRGPFERWLKGKNLAKRTIQAYREAVTLLDAFLKDSGMPRDVTAITREHVGEFIIDILEHRAPATAANRYRSLQQFFNFLVEEGELSESPMAKMHPPNVPEQPVPVLQEEELRRLLRACEGTTFEDRRDTALVRFMIDTGCRIGEVLGLRWCPEDEERHDLDLDQGLARVQGKGRRWRTVSINNKAARAMDRYLRLRDRHPNAGSPRLWLGRQGPLTDQGLRLAIRRRGERAGLGRIHPHQLRHTFAHQWLADERSEENLLRLMGWRDRSMLSRYAASTGQERALKAHKRDPLGDRL